LKHSSNIPVRLINLYFEEVTTGDIDLIQITVDTDIKKKKIIILYARMAKSY